MNPSTVDWPLVASVVGGACFSGPAHIIARALSTACYPLTFDPRREGTVEVIKFIVHVHVLNYICRLQYTETQYMYQYNDIIGLHVHVRLLCMQIHVRTLLMINERVLPYV